MRSIAIKYRKLRYTDVAAESCWRFGSGRRLVMEL